MFDMRTAALALAASLFLAAAQAQPAPPSPSPVDGIRVTLLGTGTPALRIDRFGPATLVQAGPLNLLFDAGRGVTMRLGQLHMPAGSIDATFLTHFHSDHTNGLPDLYLSGYVPLPLGGRQGAMQLYGPPGVAELAQGLTMAYRMDRVERGAAAIPEAATTIETHVVRPGVVFDQDGVTVEAFHVHHDVSPETFGYKITHAGHVVVISGDTAYQPQLGEIGKGADVFVHEVAAAAPQLADDPFIKVVLSGHTAPEDVGRVFAAARPRLGVLTHIVQLPDHGPIAPTDAQILERVRSTYTGDLLLGHDLTRIEVSNAGISVTDADD